MGLDTWLGACALREAFLLLRGELTLAWNEPGFDAGDFGPLVFLEFGVDGYLYARS